MARAKRFECRSPRRGREGGSPGVRRTADGSDIVVKQRRADILSNPSYRLALMTLSRRRNAWCRFFLCRHWLILTPLGLLVGIATMSQGVPTAASLFSVPLAVAYYLMATQHAPSYAREMARKGRLVDLYMIPYYDPLVMLAGLSFAGRYEYRRAGSAASAFVGFSIFSTALLMPQIDPQYTAVAFAAFAFSWVLYRKSRMTNPNKTYTTSYRDMKNYMDWLEGSGLSVVDQSIHLWVACVLMTAVCALCAFKFPQLGPAMTAMLSLSAFALFTAIRPSALVPSIQDMRRQLAERVRRCVSREGQFG